MLSSILSSTLGFILVGSVLVGCQNTSSTLNATYPKFPYQLQTPSKNFKLPKKLQEISGITIYKDKWIVAVQDEKGKLFLLDIETADFKESINFSADGDYEDIVCVGETLYAIRADGVLFEITHWQDKDSIQTKVIDTNLGEINNTEGLTYLADSNDLLIACKESALIGQQEHKFRAFYTFDLDAMTFKTDPLFSISRKQFKSYIKDNLKGFLEYDLFKKELKKQKKVMPLQPSAIAIHPLNKDIYILAAVGNSLLVLDSHHHIKSCHFLPSKMFEQPEGLAFDTKGGLYIASEGKKKKARIYKFDYILPK